MRVLLMEEQHYELSDKLMGSLLGELTARGNDPANMGRPFMGMKITELFSAIVASTELQRVALGFPAKGPKTRDEQDTARRNTFLGSDAAIEAAAKTYEGKGADQLGANGLLGDNDGGASTDSVRKQVNRLIASDPESAERLQQAAIDVYMKMQANRDGDTENANQANQASQEQERNKHGDGTSTNTDTDTSADIPSRASTDG
jgi:hypothetical protein